MKTPILLSLVLTASGFANDDLASVWTKLIDAAKQDSKISVSSSHTGHHGGVSIMTPSEVKFMLDQKGDAVLTLHSAASKKFSAWAKKNGATSSNSNLSDGETTLRIKATNDDSLSLLYRPSTAKGSNGTFTVVFVDASKFSAKAK